MADQETSDGESSEMQDSQDVVLVKIPGWLAQSTRKTFEAFTGWASAYAEGKRVRNEARTMLTVRDVARELDEPQDLVERALLRDKRDLIRKQVSRERVASLAIEDLERNSSGENSGEINEDWLNIFGRVVEERTSDDFRIIFGKILAGEIRKPGLIPLKLLDILSTIDMHTAKNFERICSLLLLSNTDDGSVARMYFYGDNFINDELRNYGLSYIALTELCAAGLLATSFSTARATFALQKHSSKDDLDDVNMPGSDGGVITIGKVALEKIKKDEYIQLPAASLTSLGLSLYRILDVPKNLDYFSELNKWMRPKGFHFNPPPQK